MKKKEMIEIEIDLDRLVESCPAGKENATTGKRVGSTPRANSRQVSLMLEDKGREGETDAKT